MHCWFSVFHTWTRPPISPVARYAPLQENEVPITDSLWPNHKRRNQHISATYSIIDNRRTPYIYITWFEPFLCSWSNRNVLLEKADTIYIVSHFTKTMSHLHPFWQLPNSVHLRKTRQALTEPGYESSQSSSWHYYDMTIKKYQPKWCWIEYHTTSHTNLHTWTKCYRCQCSIHRLFRLHFQCRLAFLVGVCKQQKQSLKRKRQYIEAEEL